MKLARLEGRYSNGTLNFMQVKDTASSSDKRYIYDKRIKKCKIAVANAEQANRK